LVEIWYFIAQDDQNENASTNSFRIASQERLSASGLYRTALGLFAFAAVGFVKLCDVLPYTFICQSIRASRISGLKTAR
jgi:hypothetical protein